MSQLGVSAPIQWPLALAPTYGTGRERQRQRQTSKMFTFLLMRCDCDAMRLPNKTKDPPTHSQQDERQERAREHGQEARTRTQQNERLSLACLLFKKTFVCRSPPPLLLFSLTLRSHIQLPSSLPFCHFGRN